jgi:haloalkane dehalogenase
MRSNTELLRTPSDRFKDIPNFPYTPRYIDVSDELTTEAPGNITEALMAYVEAGNGEETILCLHGEPSWSFLYRKMMPILAEQGRVIAPDLIGFGRSDKLPRVDDHSFELHRKTIGKLIETLDLENITLVCQDWGGPIGMGAAVDYPERFDRLVVMNTALPAGTLPMPKAFEKWDDFVEESEDLPIGRIIEQGLAIGSNEGYVSELSDDVLDAYKAPFPDTAYQAGAFKLPSIVPLPDRPGPAAESIGTIAEELQEWEKPALVLFSEGDPITAPGRTQLRELIPTAEEADLIENAGHFLQENKGQEVANRIVEFMGENEM